MLNLRQFNSESSSRLGTTSERLTSLQFHVPSGRLGNIGESLQYGEDSADRDVEDDGIPAPFINAVSSEQ